jgi:hypothetical protein
MEEAKMPSLLSAIIFVIGILLMAGKICVDSEPGAIPLLLAIIGAGGYVIPRYQNRTHPEDR